jgi:chemotaxis protein histidine kinase CheA
MKTIAALLKKPAREENAFRTKLEEILDEVDRVRREAAACKLTALESTARAFEDAVHDLRNRSTLSGGDFLPLAVKLDHLFNQFASIKSLTLAGSPARDAARAHAARPSGAAQLIEAGKLPDEMAEAQRVAGTHEASPAGSLDAALETLTDHVAQEQHKQVVLASSGLQSVPPHYQAAVKNVAVQLIRNAVMHGIEAPSVREASGKTARGTLRLDFRVRDRSYELFFEDDGRGLDPEQVRETAVAHGIVTAAAAEEMRDRDVIKLIFKSRYTTLSNSGGDIKHGVGMSLVRRYVHEAGGKIAFASLPGYETRFKITLPATPGEATAPESKPADQSPTVQPPADAKVA